MPQKAGLERKRRLQSFCRHASKILYRTFARHSRKIFAARKCLKKRIDVSTLKNVDCCIHAESWMNSDGRRWSAEKTCTTPHADIVKYSGSVCSRDTTVRSYGRNSSPVRARLRYTNLTGVWLLLRAKKLADSSPVFRRASPDASSSEEGAPASPTAGASFDFANDAAIGCFVMAVSDSDGRRMFGRS